MTRRQRSGATRKQQRTDAEWYENLFTAEEWAVLQRWLESPPETLAAEVAVMRVLIHRVMERLGADDPAQALPLVRQAVDAICRTLRARQVLKEDAAAALVAAYEAAVEEMGKKAGKGTE